VRERSSGNRCFFGVRNSCGSGNFFSVVTGLFLSNENTIGPAVDLLALVLREASRDR